MTRGGSRRYREVAAGRLGEWVDAGFRERDFFPHRSFYLHKAAPDGYKLAVGSGFRPDGEQLWRSCCSLPPALDGLPNDLFFDDDRCGIASTSHSRVRSRSRACWCKVRSSTRPHHWISYSALRRREYKTRVDYDDFPMHQAMSYERWEERVFELAGSSDFLALSLHDCYGPAWLEHYPTLLDRLRDLGTMKTLDQVAAEVTLEDAG